MGRSSRKTLKILHPSAWNLWTWRDIIPVAVLCYVAHLTKKRWDYSDRINLISYSVSQYFFPLCNPMDYSLPSSSVRELFLTRISEWVAISSSRGSSWLSCISYTAGRFLNQITGAPKTQKGTQKENTELWRIRTDAPQLVWRYRGPCQMQGNLGVFREQTATLTDSRDGIWPTT